jgi:hypothetical protein
MSVIAGVYSVPCSEPRLLPVPNTTRSVVRNSPFERGIKGDVLQDKRVSENVSLIVGSNTKQSQNAEEQVNV